MERLDGNKNKRDLKGGESSALLLLLYLASHENVLDTSPVKRKENNLGKYVNIPQRAVGEIPITHQSISPNPHT